VNVRGAGLLALASLGHIEWEEVSGLVPIGNVLEPDPTRRDIHDRGYETFQAIYKSNRRTYRRLHRSRR
jgi:hypothetical protein